MSRGSDAPSGLVSNLKAAEILEEAYGLERGEIAELVKGIRGTSAYGDWSLAVCHSFQQLVKESFPWSEARDSTRWGRLSKAIGAEDSYGLDPGCPSDVDRLRAVCRRLRIGLL